MINFTKEALGLMTESQRDTIRNMCDGDAIDNIDASVAFDLPTGYLALWLRYKTGNNIYGGLSPEGDLST